MYALNEVQKETLYKALFHLKIKELKNLCRKLSIQPHGEKTEFIENIYQFVTTGKPTQPRIIPSNSKSKPKMIYRLTPDALILYGAFKNDLKTRIFFKKLIGDHFHYTAFGIDWIKERWLTGTPPTYVEFADYWQKEYTQRKSTPAPMKPEWAYLNYLDRYKKSNPHASKSESMDAWKIYQQEQVTIVENILHISSIL